MKAIIIKPEVRHFYVKKFDEFNSIIPYELTSGEFYLSADILTMLQTYADNVNFPQSVRESAKLTKLELEGFELREITEADLKTGELPQVDLFPYPELTIRVDISHSAVTQMIESPYKMLIDYALTCTKERNVSGYVIWLRQLDNPQMTAEQVSGVLESFGAQIQTNV